MRLTDLEKNFLDALADRGGEAPVHELVNGSRQGVMAMHAMRSLKKHELIKVEQRIVKMTLKGAEALNEQKKG